MRNKLNTNKFSGILLAILFAVIFVGCSAKQELPKFIPDDNAVDLPAHIAPDQKPPH